MTSADLPVFVCGYLLGATVQFVITAVASCFGRRRHGGYQPTSDYVPPSERVTKWQPPRPPPPAE